MNASYILLFSFDAFFFCVLRLKKIGGKIMKTMEMKMEALQDVKEQAYLVEAKIVSLKQRLAEYGASISEELQENIIYQINVLEQRHNQLMQNVDFYQKQLLF